MADEDDAEHPSDLHRGKRLIFNATLYDDDKGAQVKAEFDGAYEAALEIKYRRTQKELPSYAEVADAMLDVIRKHGHATPAMYLKVARLCNEFTQSLNGHRAAQVSSGDLGR